MKTFGGVDLLFANTGGPPAGTVLSFDDLAWQGAFELLLMSVVRSVRLVVPSMLARNGGAVLVGTSSSVKEPLPNLALSNVLRSGVTRWRRRCRSSSAPQRIRVNTRFLTHRDRSPTAARRDRREEVGRATRGLSGGGGGDHSARPLRHTGRLRTRRRVSAIGRGLLHHGRGGTGRRRHAEGAALGELRPEDPARAVDQRMAPRARHQARVCPPLGVDLHLHAGERLEDPIGAQSHIRSTGFDKSTGAILTKLGRHVIGSSEGGAS